MGLNKSMKPLSQRHHKGFSSMGSKQLKTLKNYHYKWVARLRLPRTIGCPVPLGRLCSNTKQIVHRSSGKRQLRPEIHFVSQIILIAINTRCTLIKTKAWM